MFVTKLHVQIRRRQSYFALFLLLLLLFFAAARRSVFLRRAARFFTLSRPWLFPIGSTFAFSCEFPKLFQLLDHAAINCGRTGNRLSFDLPGGRVPAVHPRYHAADHRQ